MFIHFVYVVFEKFATVNGTLENWASGFGQMALPEMFFERFQRPEVDPAFRALNRALLVNPDVPEAGFNISER